MSTRKFTLSYEDYHRSTSVHIRGEANVIWDHHSISARRLVAYWRGTNLLLA